MRSTETAAHSCAASMMLLIVRLSVSPALKLTRWWWQLGISSIVVQRLDLAISWLRFELVQGL